MNDDDVFLKAFLSNPQPLKVNKLSKFLLKSKKTTKESNNSTCIEDGFAWVLLPLPGGVTSLTSVKPRPAHGTRPSQCTHITKKIHMNTTNMKKNDGVRIMRTEK